MSRQGEGYGYPDNSIEAIGAAMSDGYRNIRISVAHTSDNVWYCTHSYEMQHNSTNHCLTYAVDGSPYANDLDINSTTSAFLDTLLYNGRPIPKLADALKLISRYNSDVTIEMKDDISASVASSLVDLVIAYRKDAVFSGTKSQCQTICNLYNGILNVAVIFNYTDSLHADCVATFITSGIAKSLRCDCYYGDTVTEAQLADIHETGTLKFGGGGVTAAQALGYLEYLDVMEYNLQYNTIATQI
jgi:glycerophosphoryl diester phosphodiesterase